MVGLLNRASRGLLAATAIAAAPAAQAADDLVTSGGDSARGRSLFQSNCAICHSADPDGRIVVGPPLFGVVDRPVAAISGFDYSGAMQAAGFTWTAEQLKTYLHSPRTLVPGGRMRFRGLEKPGQAEDVVAYLETLK